MQNMREVDIEMHVRNAAGAANKKHRELFHKSPHQLVGPGKIFCQLRGVLKNIEEEDAPCGRSLADHVDVFAKGFVIIGRIDGCVRITLDIVVERNLFITYALLEKRPVPLAVGGPASRK